MTDADAAVTALARHQVDALGAEFAPVFDRFRTEHGLDLAEACDAIAVAAGRRFLAGELAYDVADALLNAVWVRITDAMVDEGDGFRFPELAYAVYDAFDAGEYDHGDGLDPVAAHTVPLLREALAEGG
ncbi:MAG: hypothetical protein QNJ12_23370 [Ilumatobacter sp.]|uniref:hypothetical protein n=1 Tax=Ilumatobacter sp. TaxID=1967498 RepID=UPI0026067074|nr:hypothetical protein [Ilumatobacter sp.]MDJ0771746.1 hypothetical protein [Ilumatobacter sp.]